MKLYKNDRLKLINRIIEISLAMDDVEQELATQYNVQYTPTVRRITDAELSIIQAQAVDFFGIDIVNYSVHGLELKCITCSAPEGFELSYFVKHIPITYLEPELSLDSIKKQYRTLLKQQVTDFKDHE